MEPNTAFIMSSTRVVGFLSSPFVASLSTLAFRRFAVDMAPRWTPPFVASLSTLATVAAAGSLVGVGVLGASLAGASLAEKNYQKSV